METDVYMLHYKVWVGEDLAWKINRSRLYTLVMMHCPPDLKEVLKTMSVWNAVSEAHNVIGLLKMVHNVAHDQTEARQSVMRFVEFTAKSKTERRVMTTTVLCLMLQSSQSKPTVGNHGIIRDKQICTRSGLVRR